MGFESPSAPLKNNFMIKEIIMNIELIRRVSSGYIRLFPELLARYFDAGDRTIVKLISEKVSENSEIKGVVNIPELEKKIVEELNLIKNES